MKIKRIAVMIMIFIFCLLFLAGCATFSKVKKEARVRFSGYEEKADSLQTSLGKITFIDEGQGQPLLICHGICGGYDQAYDAANEIREDFRVIAPSRFGYPGSDLPEEASIEMQVQAFLELLDFLNIEKTYLLATSAGSTVAIKFALMHPERTKGLILYCSGFPALEARRKKSKYAGPPSLFCSDFAMWLISPLFKPLMGMSPDTLKEILPMKDRKAGVIFDAKVTNTVMINNYTEYDLSKLEVPVLIIHAKDDKLADFNKVEAWIPRIKNCTFVPLESGGHLMTDNGKVIREAVKEFLNENN